MYCSNCGKENSSEARFCYNCGIDMAGMPSAVPVMNRDRKFDISQLSGLTIIYVLIISVLSLIGSVGWGLFVIAISYLLSIYAINNMTYKINGSVNWAFAIIMSFGIPGYIIYWIWFLTQRHRIRA